MNKKNQKGFSLIEALIATAISGIAFVGVFGLTGYSANSINSATKQQSLQEIANQIVEVIETDKANILNYNMSFATCVAPTQGQTAEYHQNRYKWCRMLNNLVGNPKAGDVRNISVVSGVNQVTLHITLQATGGYPEVVLKKIYDN
ncbi:MAG: type II secretion system protein [Rickettsiales bacterium]|nr:type II secretion system protein [Rickettsiales bacterium]